MKKNIILFCFALSGFALCAQFNTIEVNKPLKDFPDVSDLSTPLSAGVTILYSANVKGYGNIWRDASVYSNSCSHEKGTIPDRVVDEDSKESVRNSIIKEVIVYKDSVACVIRQIDSTYYSIRVLGFEEDRWLNMFENGKPELESAREWFYTHAPEHLDRLRMSNTVQTVSADTLAFINYVKQQGAEPKEFLLKALANHPLVIYGEIHRRKVSWDLLSSVLQDPRFPETVGTVFLEMPAYQQSEFERFYASKELDTEILLDIMRSEQIDGWWDRGEYEFLVNLWKLNKTLPAEKQIRVVPTDEQAPWKLLKTSEELEEYDKKSIDRNTRMADVVEQTIKSKTDKRNCLFVVGYGHARKSLVPGGYSSAEGQEPALTAGAQLAQRFSDKDIFTVLQHGPMLRNVGGAVGFVRQSLFDVAFEQTGNKPVAFRLTDSPFGAEPYDADFDDAFDSRAGNYANNFDGYIFLQPLKEEKSNYLLYDIASDNFIQEMKRRIELVGWGDLNRWFDIEGEVTTEKIINSCKEDEGKKRWGYLFD